MYCTSLIHTAEQQFNSQFQFRCNRLVPICCLLPAGRDCWCMLPQSQKSVKHSMTLTDILLKVKFKDQMLGRFWSVFSLNARWLNSPRGREEAAKLLTFHKKVFLRTCLWQGLLMVPGKLYCLYITHFSSRRQIGLYYPIGCNCNSQGLHGYRTTPFTVIKEVTVPV